MTKHNLGDHLAWLLNRGPSLYPSLDLLGNTSSGNPRPGRSPPGQSPNPPEVPTTAISNSNPVAPAACSNAAQTEDPTLDQADIFNRDGSTVTSDNNMARLQFAPQPSSKPRMLSYTNGASTPKTPTASKQRGPQSSQSRIESRRQIKDISDGTSTSPTDWPPRKTPSHSRFNFPSPLADIDSIDLTGDLDDQDSSSATVEAFGEPRPVWREDSASRAEPLAKRGKKRKSDEYKSDLQSPRKSEQRVNTIQSRPLFEDLDSFVAIDDFDEDLEFHEAPTGQTSSMEKKSQNREKSPQERTILDSEDDDIYDDEQMVVHDGIAEPLTRMDIDSELYPKLPDRQVARRSENPSRFSSSGGDKKKETGNSPGGSFSASHFQRDSPTQGTRKPHHHEGSSLNNRHQQSPPKGSRKIAAPQSFPVSPDMFDSLEKLRHGYKQDVNRNAMFIYEQAIQGLPQPALLNQNKALNDKLSAIEQLYSEKKEYDLCLTKNEELKRKIIQGFANGDHAMADCADMDESRKLVEELQKREATAHELLQRIGALGSDIGEADIKTPPQYTLVAGTQMPAISSEPVKKGINSATTDDAGLPSHPARLGPSTAPRNGTVDLHFDGSRNSPLGGYRPSSPSKSNLSHNTQSKLGSSRRLETNFENKVHNTIPEEDDFMWDEDDDVFSRNMGSATISGFDNADFDDDADDSDLLEAAQIFENRQSLATEDYRSHNRQIFSETSGNINRAPLANKTGNSYPESLPAAAQHPWSNDVRTALTTRFQLRGFRHNQLEAIDATLSGKDTFVLMPTGGGKSLCYQLPSVISSGRTRGVTIVISPLLSLMQDQVSHLKKLRIRATMLNGEVAGGDRKEILSILHEPRVEEKIQLLYVTPEMVSLSNSMMAAFRSLSKHGKLARIVIDEAHCVSQWGHDFRPDYKMLGKVRGEFPGVPVMALTATATENVKIDIIHNLGIPNCKVFTQSFNRPNLTYEVLKKVKGANILANMAEKINTKYKRQSGIVYCLSRVSCEKVAERLREEHGIRAAHYHAGMESQERASVQRDWQSGKYHVIVATIAFGMGIDKPDVRFVIHHTIPKSLEGYYQETGRAGRDGKPSGCYLYYGFQDTTSLRQMINKGEGSVEQKHRQHQMLRNVVHFCENRSDCRRVQVLAYFNERFQKENCKRSCDNCKNPEEFVNYDFTEHATWGIKLVRSYLRWFKQKNNNKPDDEKEKDRLTLHYCADLLCGKNPRKLLEHELAHIEGHGTGSNLDKGDVVRLFQRLLLDDALAEDNKTNGRGFTLNYVTLGYRAEEFARGEHPVKFLVPVSSGKPRKAPKKNNGAGIRAAGDEHPESTNVSSPVQSMSRRRLQRNQVRSLGTVQSDGDEDEDEDEDDDDEFYGFEPIREAGQSTRNDSHDLGPPITNDEKMDNLNDIQKIILDFFLEKAKHECSRIMMEKGLRNQPFPDSILRDMGISFPKDKQQLLTIPNIDGDRVERYGTKFLKLIREARTKYEELTGQESFEDPSVPNRCVSNTISIRSDDNYGDDGMGEFLHDQELDELSGDERSAYFEQPAPPPPGFSEHISQFQADNSGPGRKSGSRSKGGQRGKRGFKGKKTGGSSKQKGVRSSNGSSTNGRSFGSKRGGGSKTSTSSRGGIGMMPT